MAENMAQDVAKTMIVAIDESECSRYALEWALQNLNDSILKQNLIIFTVQSISDYTYLQASTYGTTPPELIRSFQENQNKLALDLLDRAKNICSYYGIMAQAITEVGDPKYAICEAVENYNAQLLVLGSHGRGALKTAFLGSVSDYCVHYATCPVLVVRRPV